MPADRTESRDRFERVIIPRVQRAVQAVELIGNGAARNYETTPEEIAELLTEVRGALDGVEGRYATRTSRPAVPLTVSTLQYPLDLVFADDDAVACAETGDDAGVFIRRFMVLGGSACYGRGRRRSRMAVAPARFLVAQVPGYLFRAHYFTRRRG